MLITSEHCSLVSGSGSLPGCCVILTVSSSSAPLDQLDYFSEASSSCVLRTTVKGLALPNSFSVVVALAYGTYSIRMWCIFC